ncbi:hypothetical protein BLNAU_5771 [Blattamonas nauphoetae]|uniref:DDE-1 domain-containing protein n=1 Tax=Blattamonas nauphoetae TaxID=2049346 RepID=A0ABQ9Y691_9EUKA|nr:hypothetical protein BLNAU_5771 [Blattamonas nauphoetae]
MELIRATAGTDGVGVERIRTMEDNAEQMRTMGVGVEQMQTMEDGAEQTALLKPLESALIILDGHVSRSQPELMSWLRDHHIDVIILPSHTSEFLPPLDQVVNKEWERALKFVSLPKDKRDETQLDDFMNKIDDVVTKALQADFIRKGFMKCCLILRSPTKMLKSLREEGLSFDEWKQRNTIHSIGGDDVHDFNDELDVNWTSKIRGCTLQEWESFAVEYDSSIPLLKPSGSFPISGHV